MYEILKKNCDLKHDISKIKIKKFVKKENVTKTRIRKRSNN